MLLSLDIPPKNGDPFFWTDFVELRALIHPDSCFSRGELASLASRGKDRGIKFDVETRWRDIVNFASLRTKEFGADYPFKVSEDKDTLTLEADDNNAAHTTYLNLLLASCMRHIPKNRQGEVARHFETTCLKVFSKLMPSGAEIRATWANGGEEAPYQGTLFQKMQQLAADLRCTANFVARDFKENDTGDGGIDLIAWHPMHDKRDGIPIAFAQCGCSKEDWKFKHLEAHPVKHRRHLPVMHPWATYYFMPLDLREADGGWAYDSDIGEAIIVDRLRLIRLASTHDLHQGFEDLALLTEAKALQQGLIAA